MDWDHRYRLGDTPWEKGYAAPPLSEWLEKHGPLNGRVLVPGCGSGHDVRGLAEAGSSNCTVVGLDIASAAIEQARRKNSLANAEFVKGDLFALPESWRRSFDWVFEHTCFCALPRKERSAYVETVSHLLKPKGRLLAIFFMDPWDPDEDPVNSGPPFGTDRAELAQLFDSRLSLLSEYVPSKSYPGREQRELVQLRQVIRATARQAPPLPPLD
jgi:methyl halide transferase